MKAVGVRGRSVAGIIKILLIAGAFLRLVR